MSGEHGPRMGMGSCWGCGALWPCASYVDELEQENAQLRADREREREALSYYADAKSYWVDIEQKSGRIHITSAALQDCGATARAALQAASDPGGDVG